MGVGIFMRNYFKFKPHSEWDFKSFCSFMKILGYDDYSEINIHYKRQIGNIIKDENESDANKSAAQEFKKKNVLLQLSSFEPSSPSASESSQTESPSTPTKSSSILTESSLTPTEPSSTPTEPSSTPLYDEKNDDGFTLCELIKEALSKIDSNAFLNSHGKSKDASALYNELENEIPMGYCGDNIRIKLKGIEEEDISAGFLLCSTDKPVKTSSTFEAQLAILDHKNIICAGYSAVLHIHSCVEEVSISVKNQLYIYKSSLLHLIDKKTGRKSKRPPQFVKKGQKVIAKLETQGPICLEAFSDYPQLGRFTMRDEGKTIAIGKVTKVIENEQNEPIQRGHDNISYPFFSTL
ncbi:11958_t:CDS:2 [Entrophospora sp. SA101]|nr:11958_t:CDS:2 [Entrophospora sp. SA101]